MSVTQEYPYHTDIYTDPSDLNKVIHIIDRPKIPIRISYNHRPSKTPVLCLLDSGADRNLFPAKWGESIGMKIRKGKERLIGGIGKHPSIKAYTFTGVKIDVGFQLGTKISFIAEIDFSYEHEVPLLGRNGFFDHFKNISFVKNSIVRLEF